VLRLSEGCASAGMGWRGFNVMAARGVWHVLSSTLLLDPARSPILSSIWKVNQESSETYHVLPNVLFPLDSARRKN
jgi:hypothetical protein